MANSISRRNLLQLAGGSLLANAAFAAKEWPVEPGTDAPRICVGMSRDSTPETLRQWKQVGVNYALMGGGPSPWKEADLRRTMDHFRANGIEVINVMIGGFNDVIHGGPKANEQTDNVIASIRAAGKVGLPVMEYNFYAHRLTEGYKEEIGRGGAGYTAYDYSLSRNLPPKEGIGTHTRAEQLKRAKGFLEAVVPEAEKAGVRLALHPNDPPVKMSRGSEQLFRSFEHWKEYFQLVPSPHNGMTFDCGVTRETGEDPVKVCRWLGERDIINHVHYRNVIVRTPNDDYTEVFPDEGQVDMFAVMKELVRQKYPRGIYPEHPRALDLDRRNGSISGFYPGGGGTAGLIYNVAYAKAMLQAALSEQ